MKTMRPSRCHMLVGGGAGAAIKRKAEGIALGRNLQLPLSYECSIPHCTRIHAFHRESSLWPGNCAGMLINGSCCTRPRSIRNELPGRARRLWRT